MSYYDGVRKCKNCGRLFSSDCADVCSRCFKADMRNEARSEALVRIGKFRLKIELVPETSWYSNLRNMAGKELWDKIRYQSYRASGYKCSICGRGKQSLYCHEIWEYDDEKHIQMLKGFEALCLLCHMVRHIGFAGIQSEAGKLDYNRVISHFREVNSCSYEDFLFARELAFEVWEERSMFEWEIKFGDYVSLIKGV